MRDKWIRRSTSLAAVTVAAVALAGCGGGASSSTASSGDSGELDRSATLRVATAAPSRNLDPYLQTSVGGYGYLSPIFDRLTVVDADGNLQPGLAESWEFAPDGSYLELKLREGVAFHDGAPFDANAVVANIVRGQTMEGSTVVAAMKSIVGTDVVDDYTVRLQLAPGAGVELPGVFSTNAGMMISPRFIEAGTDIRNDPGESGSGAYVVSTYVPEESLTLTRAEGQNWDPEAGKVAGIEIKAMPDASTRLNGLETGAVDLSWISSANEVVEAQSLAKSGTLAVDEVSFRNVLGVYMRAQGDLAQPEVRQAVAYSIDPAAVSALFSGTCKPHQQLFPSDSWAADDSYQYPYAFDPDKAKSLVQGAGGAPKIALTFGAGTNTEKPANVIQSMLAAAGFDAELNPVPNSQNEPRYIAGDFQSMVANSFTPKVDPAETASTYITGSYDLSNGNPQIKELAAEAANPTLSQDERAPMYRDIAEQTLEEAMFVPICNLTNATVATGNVTGIDEIAWVNNGLFDVRHVGIAK